MEVKRILITGARSYVGTSFEKWLAQWPDRYQIDTLDMRCDKWREKSFEGYDAVFHVAGIAHVSADPKMEDVYYSVNRDLAVGAAQKSKSEGVAQFIFMSSIIIYGKDDASGKGRTINAETQPSPVDFYGKSKWEADLGVRKLAEDGFNVTVIRSPMIYGPGCKGNFPKLLRLARNAFIFPKIENVRSMIYIDNLCEFVRLSVDNCYNGIFSPQNAEYVSTVGVVKTYRRLLGKRTLLIPVPTWCVRLFSKVDVFNKAFGTKVYEKPESAPEDYQKVGFEESIRRMTVL